MYIFSFICAQSGLFDDILAVL